MFIDTSAWIALFSQDDSYHEEMKNLILSLIQSRKLLYTSNFVFTETVTRLNIGKKWPYTFNFIDFFENSIKSGALTRYWIDNNLETQAVNFLKKYSDHRLSLTDATIAILVKKHRLKTIVTTDGDFSRIGLSVLPASKN